MTMSKQWPQQFDSETSDFIVDEKKIQFEVPSFAQIYKTSYSHGLEKIYALENIDIRSVRKINEAPISEIVYESDDIASQWIEEPSQQLEFSFNNSLQSHFEPFIIREPIQVLRLSKHAEKILLGQGKLCIKDLLSKDFRTQISIKGLGQGHIDEIRMKLQGYLEGHPIHDIRSIDFISWAKTLVADLDLKKTYVALESFQLSSLISLSSSDAIEVRRLPVDKRMEWLQESIGSFRSDKKMKQVNDDMSRIVAHFINPWLQKRFGFATEGELLERLLHLSESFDDAQLVIEWMKSVYFNDQFPLSNFLTQVDKKIFCIDDTAAIFYEEIVKKANSYFYKSGLHYPFTELVCWINREFAKMWHGYAEGFVERLLRLSPQFRVRKNSEGELIIKQALF